MLFTSLNQFIVLALLFIVGWLFGLASHSGSRKWRERLKAEAEQHSAYRHDVDAQLKDAQRRVADLERENAVLEKHRSDVTAAEAARTATIATAAASDVSTRGSFGAGGKDDLTRIRGVDAAIEGKLRDLGVKSFGDVEVLTPRDESDLEQRIGLSPGQISRDQWRDQAIVLREGQEAARRERVPPS